VVLSLLYEEILFRGLLAGWLHRRLGFAAGNWVQTLLFLAPHLLLLTVRKAIWPVFIVQVAAGWLQGWLLYRSGSILPGWLLHTASNVASALSAMTI
jgi:membrane protease YdiL (CAAX protease family)